MTEVANNGAAPGFSPGHALKVSVEIRRQFSRPSIRLVLVAIALLPIGLAASVARGKFEMTLAAEYIGGVATASGANFVVFALYTGSQLAMPLLVAYVFGESIAREAQWSFLPVLLTTPVGRGQLLQQKAIACAVVCLIGLLLFSAVSAVFGLACFGTGPLIPISGPHIPLSQMLWRFAAMLAYIACYLTWIAALAMLLSVLAGANTAVSVGGTMAIILVSHLFGGLATLGRSRGFLPTRNFDAWTDLADTPIDLIRVNWGTFLSVLYATALALATYGSFATKDIRSNS
ncbi:hypothetical protein [Mycobacterium sp. OTB74]|jgi:ABC-2 type transport system permease protein|uniref:ABC transporter permease n=1 Tax=Mycobacterium sp. OTB74 TaxID=1853452 RepID=UPI002472EF20|nr:hypothetical protein [Mycobacterium sp. OTB74]MDH6245641.1 ABC-2 type transport system permease protein [Mycobacterium sp. OTB74]